MKIQLLFIISIILLRTEIVVAQDWLKSIKTVEKSELLKEVEKKIKKEIKPLTIDFKISDVGYNPFKSINTLNLTIDFTGENPNPLGVTFNRMEFNLFVNDTHLSKFYNDKNISIPKNDVFFFQEIAEVKILEAGKTIFNAIREKNAVYTLVGKYFVESPFGTFSFDIKLMEKEVNKEKSER